MAGTISRGRGGVSRALNFNTLVMLVASVSVVAGCDRDAPTGLKAGDDQPARVVEIASPANSAYDSGINRNDSWVEQTQTVAETTTVTSSEPFDDPNTGQPTYTTTVGTDPQTVNVSAGYGYDGQPRFTAGFQQTSTEETIWLQRVTDVTVDSRPDGSITLPFLYDPMEEVGSLQGAVLDAGGGSGGAGTGGTCTQITGCDAWLRAPKDTTAVAPFGMAGPTFRGIGGARRRSVVRTPRHVKIEETLGDAGTGLGLLALRPASASSFPEGKTEHRVTRDYERQDGEWLLKHTMHETDVRVPDGRMRFALHLTVSRSKVHRNKEKDAERRNARLRPDSTSAPVSARTDFIASEACDPATAIIPCDPAPLPGYSPEPTPVDMTMVLGGDYVKTLASSGPPLVMQHGFMSDGRTWERMSSWLGRDVSTSGIYRISVPWDWKYEDQAGILQRSLGKWKVPSGAILIGHSNGGMVSRYLARHPRASNDYTVPAANIAAVITVGTPHSGAPLARHAKSVNRLFAWGGRIGLLICRWSNTAGCHSFSNISGSTLGNIYTALTNNVPVLGEMQPSDAYHEAFNGEYEMFRRFGVSSEIWTRWMEWRGYGDAYCYPESACGGAAQVKKIDRIYKRDISCLIISSLFGRIDHAIRCAADAVFLRGTDEIYRRYVDFGGDGIVPNWSQRYPFIPDQDRFIVSNGPFHWGETQSSRVGNRLEHVLVRRLGLFGTVALAP